VSAQVPVVGASKTPLTDAAELDGSHFSDWGVGPSGYVTADFARSLELRFAEAQTKIARLESDCAAYREDMKEMQRDAREAIAEAAHRERTGDPYGTY
jgi:hypothetical protein